MHDILFSPYIVPLGAFVVAIAAIGFGTWKKVRDREMDHEIKLKEMDLELARLKGTKPE